VSRAAIALAGCVLAVSGCAVHGFKPPTGPAVPAPDGLAIWQRASAQCRSATTFSAQLHVSGTANGQRVRGTIDGAVTAADRIYLRANAPFGQTAFTLGGAGDRATLYLPHDNRVTIGRAAEIVDAMTGLSLGPRDLLGVLSGCVFKTDGDVEVTRIGDHLRVKASAGEVFLRQSRGDWEIEGGVLAGLVIGYTTRSGGWPTRVVITSAAASTNDVALRIDIEQVSTEPLPDSTFVITVPSDAQPLAMNELRAMFGGKGR
jgi:hypothetical protein